MDTDDNGLILPMTDKQNLKDIGAKVRLARDQLNMTQAELGAALWPKLKKASSQSRVFRIESGKYHLDYNTAHRLFDMLAIYDVDPETLTIGNSKEPLCLHRKLAIRYPELHHYFSLINAAASANRFKEVAQLVNLLPNIFSAELTPVDDATKQQNGELDPFAKGGRQ